MRFQRRQLLSRVSIQSKLVVMLVLCTIVAATVVGVIGFRAGRASLRDSVLNRLTELRQSQSRELKDQLSDLKNGPLAFLCTNSVTALAGAREVEITYNANYGSGHQTIQVSSVIS